MQRSLGLALIMGGSLATIAAMFLTAFDFAERGGLPFNWWETFSGLDIAIAVASGLAATLALIALVTRHRVVTSLSLIAGATVFGLAFALIPETFKDTAGIRAGFWIVGGTGAISLAGAVVVSLSKTD
jgi:hypothetical protein